MARRTCGAPFTDGSYKQELHNAMSRFLPHQGLPLLADDDPRSLDRPVAGDRRGADHLEPAQRCWIVLPWPARPCWRCIQPANAPAQRRRILQSPDPLWPGGAANTGPVLATLRSRDHPGHWLSDGWLVFGVDGSKFNCPRTVANEQAFGVSGKNNSGPQQLLTCLFHAATGMLWGWTRDGVNGAGERNQFRRLLPLLPPEALLLADAGFCGYGLLKALKRSGQSLSDPRGVQR